MLTGRAPTPLHSLRSTARRARLLAGGFDCEQLHRRVSLHALCPPGEDESFICGGNMKLVWSGKPRETKGPPAFQVDMRSCEDVAAWAALRGVLHPPPLPPVLTGHVSGCCTTTQSARSCCLSSYRAS
jgi:hypothetical protein